MMLRGGRQILNSAYARRVALSNFNVPLLYVRLCIDIRFHVCLHGCLFLLQFYTGRRFIVKEGW